MQITDSKFIWVMGTKENVHVPCLIKGVFP